MIKSKISFIADEHESKVFKAQGSPSAAKTKSIRTLATVPPYVGIGLSIILIFYIIPLIDNDRKKYLFASIGTGSLGSFIFLMGVFPIAGDYEPIWLYFGAVITATGMLAFMKMSGFKAK